MGHVWAIKEHCIYEIKQISCNCLKWGGERDEGRDDGGDLNNVQYKPNQNCPLYELPHIMNMS
jgi:hypothetical protein